MRTLFSVAFYSLVFTLLLNNQVFASDDEFMEFDDFLFEVVDLVNKKVKVQVPVVSVNIVNRTVDVDLQNVAVNVKNIERQKVKDINTLCGENVGYCFLDVQGTLREDGFFPKYIIDADDVYLWFAIGVAVSESGYTYIGISEAEAISGLEDEIADSENYVSDEIWVDGPGSFVVGHGEGVSEFFAGWSFNSDLQTAQTEALKNCNDLISGIANFGVECGPIVFDVPWW